MIIYLWYNNEDSFKMFFFNPFPIDNNIYINYQIWDNIRIIFPIDINTKPHGCSFYFLLNHDDFVINMASILITPIVIVVSINVTIILFWCAIIIYFYNIVYFNLCCTVQWSGNVYVLTVRYFYCALSKGHTINK